MGQLVIDDQVPSDLHGVPGRMLNVFQHIVIRKLPLVLRGQWGVRIAPGMLSLPVTLNLVDPEVIGVALRVRRIFDQLGEKREREFFDRFFIRLRIGGNWGRIL